jgi:large repetitive protein
MRTCALLIGLAAITTVKANHVVGAAVHWSCVGNNQYEITLDIFRDCFGITLGTLETVAINSPCDSLSLTVTNVSIVEASQLCPDELVNSTCNGGTLPGVEVWTYTAVVTLPPCDSWSISWESCCRSGAIVNLDDTGPFDTYVVATFNNADFPCDDAPVFSGSVIPYVCLNQPAAYSFAAIDPEGDSLSYEFISAMATGGIPIPYMPGYTYLQPIPGITLDPFTGLVTFTPTLQGNFVVVVQVTEYDDLGNVMGTVMHDVQFVVMPCQNVQPDPSSGVITNLNGSAVQTGTRASSSKRSLPASSCA